MIGSHNNVMLKRPLQERFSQRPFQHMDERANLTLQDRLVKELRLRGISTPEATNAFAGEFMAGYNRRFAKPPRHDVDVHRPLENNENLEATFTWREQRNVSKNLTLQYDKKQQASRWIFLFSKLTPACVPSAAQYGLKTNILVILYR